MNERIRELAEQAGIEFDDDFPLEPEPIYLTTLSEFEKFVELVRADEREACAKVCEQMSWPGRSDEALWKGDASDECAKAIRARGEK